jgi:hypothetical protein
VPKGGAYELVVFHDDGCKIWIDDKPVIDKQGVGDFRSEAIVTLTGKPQAFQLSYTNIGGLAYLTLYWQRVGADDGGATIIPASAFFNDRFTAEHAPQP